MVRACNLSVSDCRIVGKRRTGLGRGLRILASFGRRDWRMDQRWDQGRRRRGWAQRRRMVDEVEPEKAEIW